MSTHSGANTAVVTVRRLLDKNKAVSAGLTAFALALAAALANLVETGGVDWTEVRIAGGGLIGALIVAGVVYLTHPGDAEVDLSTARGGAWPTPEPDASAGGPMYRPPSGPGAV